MPPRKVTATTAAAYAHAPAASTAPSLYQQPTVPQTSSFSMTQTQPQGRPPAPAHAPAHATMPPVDDPVVQRIFNRLYARRGNIPHENVWTASENLAFLLRHKIGISLSENVERISIPIIHLPESHRRMAIVVVHPKDNNTLPPFPTSDAVTAATTAAGSAGANGANASTPTSTFTATPSRMPPTPTPESPGPSMSPETPNANAAPTAPMTAAQAQDIVAAAGATAMPANGPGATAPTLQRDGEAKLIIGVQCHEHHNIVETLMAEVDRQIDMSLMSGVFKWA